jgi:predicted MFS family arabinose efflux permease
MAYRWYVLILMVSVYTLSITDRYMITQVLEPIREELHLTAGGVGALTGLGLGIFYIVMGFPISWLIDRGSRRVIVRHRSLAGRR